MITDEVIISIQAGKGGDGLASFRREKYIPRGGPNGGDGGRGGNIIFETDHNLNTLSNFNTKKVFKAQNGQDGMKDQCKGKDGQDLILKIPPGTIIFELSESVSSGSLKQYYKNDNKNVKKILDCVQDGDKIIITKGGNGGWGNVHFATSTNRAPRRANPGLPGEAKVLKLELKLIADVGIIGLPNAGKSTLLSRISHARPKIADYPFTTLEPNLGVVHVDESFSFVAADIPGLIEGAAQGRGLGDKFLRHIERTRLLIHLIDANSRDLISDYQIIQNELKSYNLNLLKKEQIIVISKMETVSQPTLKKIINKINQSPSWSSTPRSLPSTVSSGQSNCRLEERIKNKILSISALTGQGIPELQYEIKKILLGKKDK